MSGYLRATMLGACAAGIIALAGCGGGGDSGSKEEAGGASEASLEAGQWDTEITLQKIELEESDPEINAFFEGAAGQKKNASMCLTAEDAAKPKPDFFQGDGSDCKYDTFTMAGGKIDSELTCSDGPLSLKVTMTGTYTKDSYAIEATAKGELLPETKGTMSMTATGKRSGECKPEEAKPAEG